MAFQPTETRIFEIRVVGSVKRTAKGHPFIECQTDAGTVAFWGGRRMDNLQTLESQTPPFRARCWYRPPASNFPSHTWWVPETARIELLEADGRQSSQPSQVLQPRSAPTLAQVGKEGLVVFVVGCTSTKIWTCDPAPSAMTFVPAQHAYRGSEVLEWLSSAERAQAHY